MRWRPLLVGFLVIARLRADPVPAAETWYANAFLPPAATATAPGYQAPEPECILKLGPIVVDASARASLEYTNNINFSSDAKAGTELTAGIGFSTDWEAMPGDRLDLAGEWVREDWLSGNGPNRWSLVLEPGSTLRYSVHVAGVEVTPFVDLSRTFDPGLAPTVGNTAIFEQATYDGGLEVSVPLHNLTVQAVVLRGLATTSGAGLGNSDSDRRMAGARLTRSLDPGFSSGVEFYAIAESFRHAPAGSSTAETANLFGNARLGEAVQVYAAIGGESVSYLHPIVALDSRHDDQLVGELTLTHRVRPNLSYSLRLADQVADNYTSDYYRVLSAGIVPEFRLNERTTLVLQSNLQHIIESLAAAGAGNVWDNEANLSFEASAKLRVTFEVARLISRIGPAGRGFGQTSVGVSASRRF